MARLPRVVIPSLPHHVTQRGNGRAQTSRRAAPADRRAAVEVSGFQRMHQLLHLAADLRADLGKVMVALQVQPERRDYGDSARN